MAATYKGILKGDRIEWVGAAPETNGGVAVEITVLAQSPAVDEATRRQRLLETLNALAASGAAEAFGDPVEWQREVRKDRPLPGREEWRAAPMVLDSNIIIYSILPQNQALRDFIARNVTAVSMISYVEVLGFHGITDPQRGQFRQLFVDLQSFEVDRPVIERAISLRQQRRMSLGDAIIAGTALVHDRVLVTRNVTDFRWIAGLRLLDPFAVPPNP